MGDKPKKTAEEIADDRLRRQYRQGFPNAVMMSKDIDVALKHFDGDDYKDPVNPEWVGMYPQTMTPAAREKAARTFAEMTGTLGWMPTYDPKLTTVESAKKVYNPQDYDIKAYDMDMNDFIPANVIIRKKFDIDANGNYVQLPEKDWKIVAANGYRLPDPSSKQQYARLKTMAYYDKYPTAKGRRQNPFSQFIKGSIYAPKSKNALASVKNFVKKVICDQFDTLIDNHPGSSVPYLFGIDRSGHDLGFVLSMSPIAMNSLVSNVARLYAAYELYPIVVASRTAETPQTTPSYLYTIFEKYVQDCSAQPAPDAEMSKEFHLWWLNKHLIHPSLETVLLRDSYIRTTLDSMVAVNSETFDDTLSAATEFDEKIGYYVDLVIKMFMNYYREAINQMLAAAQKQPLNPLNDQFIIMYDSTVHPFEEYLQGVREGKIEPLAITPMKNTDLSSL